MRRTLHADKKCKEIDMNQICSVLDNLELKYLLKVKYYDINSVTS